VSAADVVHAVLALVAIAFVGRVALALLPPGPPGFHGIAELPTTWAASHLLGSLALVAEHDLFGVLGLRANVASLLAPWAFVAVARWMTLPGGFVPRHEPRSERARALPRALTFAAVMVTVVAWRMDPTVSPAAGGLDGVASPTQLATANALATLWMCAAALRSARRAPLGRSAVIFALSAILAIVCVPCAGRADLSSIVLCSAGGAAFSIAWLRRADKRARMLAILASGGAALLGGLGWAVALALVAAIVARTAAPARARTAALSALVLAVAIALTWAGDRALELRAAHDAPLEEVLRPARIAIAALLLASAPLLVRRMLRAGPADTSDGIEEPRREISAVALAAGILLALCVVLGWLTPSRPSLAAIAPLLPICALMIGLALVRSEQPFERA
jgi:hypothetical protein